MDELEPRDLAAWEAPELPADFEDRVMARLSEEPLVHAAPMEAPTPASSSRGWVVAGVVTALAAALLLIVGMPTPEATTPEPSPRRVAEARTTTIVELGPGVRAVAQPGATISWETKPEGIAVQQVEGQVDYEVQPGTPMRVQTKAGSVEVTGTRFTVEVHAMSEVFSPRMRTLIPAGLGAAAAVVAVVAVQQGSVEARNEHGAARIEAGSHATMTDRTAPKTESAPAEAVPVAQAPVRTPKASAQDRRKHQATRAKIKAALQKRAEEKAKAALPPEEPAAGANGEETEDPFKGHLDKDYIREAVREDLIPLAIECYDDVLQVDPKFGGRLVLEFDILGDEDVGGIVDDVQPGEGTDPMPPDFVECMSESMMTVTMPPPEGGGIVHVTYPLLFEPE
ncbi:MAG: hypothetical protein AAF799_15700 [Myxococcota bacterium]